MWWLSLRGGGGGDFLEGFPKNSHERWGKDKGINGINNQKQWTLKN